jgi:cysteine synthase
MTRPEKSSAVKQMADDLAAQLQSKGFQATVEHSGSAMGPSSYVKVFDPETGRFVIDPFRISDHAKGPVQSQRVHEIWGEANAPDFSKAHQLVDDMRALGPGLMKLKELEQLAKRKGIK